MFLLVESVIRRFHEAAEAEAPTLTGRGTVTPLREFLNVGTGVDLTIRQLAEAVPEAMGFRGEILWDTSKPDGTHRKQLDVSRLAALGWRARIPLGLCKAAAQVQVAHHELLIPN